MLRLFCLFLCIKKSFPLRSSKPVALFYYDGCALQQSWTLSDLESDKGTRLANPMNTDTTNACVVPQTEIHSPCRGTFRNTVEFFRFLCSQKFYCWGLEAKQQIQRTLQRKLQGQIHHIDLKTCILYRVKHTLVPHIQGLGSHWFVILVSNRYSCCCAAVFISSSTQSAKI